MTFEEAGRPYLYTTLKLLGRKEDAVTVPEIIEEVKIEICEHYCRYPNEWDEEEEGETLEDGKCTTCPLSRLG